jgi:preprotein translocase subunit YajC
MSFLIASAHAQAQAPAPAAGFQPDIIILMLLMFGLLYFMTIRPQKKRQKEHTEMVGALQKGDEVVTNSGIMGKVARLDDDYLSLKVTDNVELKFQKTAIHAVLPKGTLKSI